MTTVTPYGGIGEIGGNKMLLKDGDTRLFLDFGMSYNQRGKYYEEYLKPRVGSGLSDLIKTGLLPRPSLPDFKGVYRSDYMQMLGAAKEEPTLRAVLLSHIHMDHSSYIAFLHEDVPIYASKESIAIAEAVSVAGQRDFESEMFNFKERPKESKAEPVQRRWEEIVPGKKFTIDGLEVVGLPVDHSVPGAMMFLIHGSEGSVLYSGDLRVEGYGKETDRSMEALRDEDIDLMFCEGTRVDSTEKRTEDDIRSEAGAVVAATKGLVVAGYAFRDVKRMLTFLDVARSSGRKLVLMPKEAYMLQILRDRGVSVPDPRTDPDVEVLIERKKSGSYDESDYNKWERQFLGYRNAVRSVDLPSGARDRIVHAGFFDMTTMLDFDMPSGSAYIHSLTEAHNEDMEIDDKRLSNWLKLLHLPRTNTHTSGHACRQELLRLISAADPGSLAPMHTTHPGHFSKLHGQVKRPRTGKPLPVIE
jgi:ribonuclease J